MSDHDFNDDFEEEEKTPVVPNEKMEELMELLRQHGAPSTSDRPTKPMRPSALRLARL